jgi:DNA-binding protein H-NS
MAKSNGTLTDKQVSAWFEGLSFDRQVSLLDSLSTFHSKIRNARIAELRRELAALDGGNGHANGAAKRGKRSKVQAKYRDPATGDTWSGRGRMSTWLAAKVKAGEKASRYLTK